MPIGEIFDELDPTADEYSDPTAVGENLRPHLKIDEEVGRRAIQKVQPELEGHSVGQFFSNLGSDVGEFAQGTWSLATYPFRHPDQAVAAAEHPLNTAASLASAVGGAYKEAYTPQENESVPGMLLRRFYEKPFSTLMDASTVGQLAFGGGGLAIRAATLGDRAAVAGGRAGEALIAAAGGVVADAPAEAAQVAQRAASAQRGIDLMAKMSERAKMLDPISLAIDGGKAIYRRANPDAVAALEMTKQMTDKRAERTSLLRTSHDEAQAKVEDAFSDLNPAERAVIRPYVTGRVNFDRPMGEQLLTHTGEWVPIKGDVIRPDALEAARQKYIPIQQELLRKWGHAPDQVAQTFGAKAMNDAREFLGDQFDPLHPQVQQYVVDTVHDALQKNDDFLNHRAAGEVITALDIAKDKQWRTELEGAVDQNLHATLEDAQKAMPRPQQTTLNEALEAMGPQGGIYWPHSAEATTRDQSTVRNILSTLGQAAPWKENEYAMFRSGVLEHQDPVKALMRAYSTFDQGKTWIQMGYEAAEQGVKDGVVTKMPRDWKFATDPDVIAGTHQVFHPGMMMTDELVEEHGQRILTRLLEAMDDTPHHAPGDVTIDARTLDTSTPGANTTGPNATGGLPAPTSIGNLNFADIMQNLVAAAEKGPLYVPRKELPVYKIPTAMGHAIKQVRDSLQPPTSPLARAFDGVTQWWNYTNLNLRATRMLNNIIGNTVFAVMQGVHPFTVRGLTSLVAAGRAVAAKAGFGGEEGARLAKVFDLPGIRSGNLQSSLSAASGDLGERLIASRNPLARAVGWGGEHLARWNQNVESAYRAASLFYELSPNAIGRAQKMLGHASDAMSLGEKIDSLAKSGADITMKTPEYRAALKSVNRFFNNYDRTTPFERMTIRRIFPYYKFFKHSTDLVTRFPFEHPLKGQLARTLGAMATQDTKDTLKQMGMNWDRDVSPHQQDSIPVAREDDPVTGKPVVWLANTKGANPFSQLSGYLAEQYLQMLNPLIKVAAEQATGINLFTRERYRGAISSMTGREVDPQTGHIQDSFNHPSMPEAFLRSFWPYQTAREVVANGRVPTDTATLLDMATNAPNAWQMDNKRGMPRRVPTRGLVTPLARMLGPVPQPVTEPNKAQRTQRKSIVSGQLASLLQRYPDRRDEILAAIDSAAGEVRSESGF